MCSVRPCADHEGGKVERRTGSGSCGAAWPCAAMAGSGFMWQYHWSGSALSSVPGGILRHLEHSSHCTQMSCCAWHRTGRVSFSAGLTASNYLLRDTGFVHTPANQPTDPALHSQQPSLSGTTQSCLASEVELGGNIA